MLHRVTICPVAPGACLKEDTWESNLPKLASSGEHADAACVQTVTGPWAPAD